VAQRFENWKDEYLRHVTLPIKTKQLLANWRHAGFRIAISSNNLETYVERLSGDWPVDIALGYQTQNGFCKGEPHFLKLEVCFGFSRDQMLFIGDSPNDARIAIQSVVPFFALLSGDFVKADFVRHNADIKFITQLSDLDDNLQEISKKWGSALSKETGCL
jgi:phosphoglycolate phosphatase-like HAD superfamily hydrolase